MKGPHGREYLTLGRLEELLWTVNADTLVVPSNGDLSFYNKKGDYLGSVLFKGSGSLVNRPE
jgi:hypothetical protein